MTAGWLVFCVGKTRFDASFNSDLAKVSNEWVMEIELRSSEFDAGTVKTIPREEIKGGCTTPCCRAVTKAPD